MSLVLDASAAVMLVVEEPGSVAVRNMVRGVPVLAPELVLAEIGNVLWRKARLSVIDAASARGAQARLARLFEELVPLRALHGEALGLALRRDHPVYDCFYVALAAREGMPLVTADRRLAQRFAGDAEIRLLEG